MLVFVSNSLIAPLPLDAPSVILLTAALVQAKVAPLVALVGVYAKVLALQIAAGVKVLLSTGCGLTVTFTSSVLAPLQLFAVVVNT